MLLPREYDLVFWTYDQRDAVTLILRINDFLSRYGADHMPVYLAGERVTLDVAMLAEALADWTSDDDLLATGLTSANGLVLRITIGKRVYPNVRFPNTLSIGFNLDYLTGIHPLLTFGRLQGMFTFCIGLFRPYYAYGNKSDEINYSEKREQIWHAIDSDKVPVAIEWFNYFDPAMVERLGGAEKLLSAPVYLAKPVEELGGIMLILQQEPFDYKNPKHLQRRQVVESYLDLSRLHELYPRQKPWWKS